MQGFALQYDDTRHVTQRPDNTGLAATRVDVAVTSVGGTLVGVYPAGPGFVDVLAWASAAR